MSYTAEEIALWRRLAIKCGVRKTVAYKNASYEFETITGKPHDPHFLI